MDARYQEIVARGIVIVLQGIDAADRGIVTVIAVTDTIDTIDDHRHHRRLLDVAHHHHRALQEDEWKEVVGNCRDLNDETCK